MSFVPSLNKPYLKSENRMLIGSTIRLSILTVCGFGMLPLNLGHALFAQQAPPRLPPPTLERPGGGQNVVADDGSPPEGSRRNPPSKSKFDELLADKDLRNFRGYEEQAIGAGWKIDGKYLFFDGSSIGDIITKKQYDNFELQFDYRLSEGCNSGVMYRVSLGEDNAGNSGPEFQILDDENHVDGSNPKTSTGSIYSMYAPQDKKTRAAGSWNSVRIIVDGNSIKHYLNSIKVLEAEIGSEDWNKTLGESKFKDQVTFGKNARGHIAFQETGDQVWYRNIRVKDLNEESTASTESPAARPQGISGSRPSTSVPGSMQRRPRFYNETRDLDDKNKGSGKGKDGDNDK